MIDTDVVAVGSGMKVTCSRDELVQKLAIVSRAVSARATVLVLGGILLRAEDGELQLAATDMELSLRTAFDAQVEGEGAVVVPGVTIGRNAVVAAGAVVVEAVRPGVTVLGVPARPRGAA